MRISEEHIDLFERHLNGELSETQLTEFDARLVYDGQFNQAFIEFQSVEEGIKTHYRNELKFKLQEVDKKMDVAPQKSKTLKMVMWSSSVAAAILIGVFIFQHFSTPNNIAIAQQYRLHEEGLPVKMSTKGKYDDAMNAFKLEEYDKASKLLQPLNTDTAYYFQGVIAFQKNDFINASNFFLKVEKSSTYFDEAQFRLGLVYLSQDKTYKTKMILRKLIDNKSEFSGVSRKILKEI